MKIKFIKVLKRCRLEIPKEARQDLGLNEGDMLIANWDKNNFSITPAQVTPRGASKS